MNKCKKKAVEYQMRYYRKNKAELKRKEAARVRRERAEYRSYTAAFLSVAEQRAQRRAERKKTELTLRQRLSRELNRLVRAPLWMSDSTVSQ